MVLDYNQFSNGVGLVVLGWIVGTIFSIAVSVIRRGMS